MDNFEEWYLNDNDGIIYDRTSTEEVCNIPSDSDDDMKRASLILTAPEMYATLEDLIFHVSNDGIPWSVLSEKIKNARKVLAKATTNPI